MFKGETSFELILILFVLMLVVIYVKSLGNHKKNLNKIPKGYKRQLTQRQLEYREYLKTDHWLEIRDKALQRAGHKCQVCGYNKNLQVHHNTYKNLGHEKPSDLVVLCWKCHKTFHHK